MIKLPPFAGRIAECLFLSFVLLLTWFYFGSPGRSRALLQDSLEALESDSELSELELEMVLGGEVVIGEEEEDDGELYTPVLLNGVSRAGGAGGIGELTKSQWEQKYGKQYPAFNGKRNVHSLLAEHDYHSPDPAAKRVRFKTTAEDSAVVAPVAAVYSIANEQNQSAKYDGVAEVAQGQNLVFRLSEDL